jgi:hypothetical protein
MVAAEVNVNNRFVSTVGNEGFCPRAPPVSVLAVAEKGEPNSFKYACFPCAVHAGDKCATSIQLEIYVVDTPKSSNRNAFDVHHVVVSCVLFW